MFNHKPQPLTPGDLANVREIVRAENIELAEAVADVMAALIKPLCDRLAECEKSLGMLIDGQALVEKTVAHWNEIGEGGEPWRTSLKDG